MLFAEAVIELTQHSLLAALQLGHSHAADQSKHILQTKLQSLFDAELANCPLQDSSKVLAGNLNHLPLSLPVQPDSHFSILVQKGLENALDYPIVD